MVLKDLGRRKRKSRMLPMMMTSMMMKSVGPAFRSFSGDDGEVVMRSWMLPDGLCAVDAEDLVGQN
jgi:hypothetical protein